MCMLFYTVWFIDKMSGGTQSFTDQVVTASIVNQAIIWSLVLGIIIMIIERIIFKRNPRQWREYFDYKDRKYTLPLTEDELHFCLKSEIMKGKNQTEIKFAELEYDRHAHLEEIAKKESKGIASSRFDNTARDLSYTLNPLKYRYIFLVVLNFLITLLCGFILPYQYTVLRITPDPFSYASYVTTTTSTTSSE